MQKPQQHSIKHETVSDFQGVHQKMDYIMKLREVEDRIQAYYSQQKLESMLNEQHCSKKGESSINDDKECNNETIPTNKKSKFEDEHKKPSLPENNKFLFGKARRMKYKSTHCTQKKTCRDMCC